MNIYRSPARRGHAAATSALAVAVLALTLTGCGDRGSDAAEAAAPVGTTSSTTPTPSTPSTPPTTSSTPDTAPESSQADTPDDSGVTLASLGKRDRVPEIDFPAKVEAVFPDGSSAFSDGMSMTVTTPAGETVSLELPNNGGGFFYGSSVYLGDGDVGYVVTQTGGEYLDTFLVVLDDGELYLPEPDDDVVFGQFAGEGPFFETYTTDQGSHLVTHVADGPEGDEYYEWKVVGRQMVPTLLS